MAMDGARAEAAGSTSSCTSMLTWLGPGSGLGLGLGLGLGEGVG